MTKRRGPLGPRRGKPVKFTPEAIEKIKVLVAQGVGRQEIANLLGVTVGSLQVTCSNSASACDETFCIAAQPRTCAIPTGGLFLPRGRSVLLTRGRPRKSLRR